MSLINFLFLLLCFNVNSVTSQFTGQKKKFSPRKAEVPFIICQVCQKGVMHLSRQIKDLRSQKNKVDEDEILGIVEKVCDPNSKHGNWIEKYDIVEENDALKLVLHDERGKCREECKTIAKACEESIAEVDTELGELLWQKKYSTSQLSKEICSKRTYACTKKPGKYNFKRTDETFITMSKDEQSAADVMKEMRGVPGMPGMEMYSREDIEKMQGQAGKKQEMQSEEHVNQEVPYKTSNPGFFETVQAVGRDVVRWFKNLFGYGSTKTEL